MYFLDSSLVFSPINPLSLVNVATELYYIFSTVTLAESPFSVMTER